MKILFCSYAFWPNVGGIETHSLLLVNALQKLGYEIIIVTDKAAPEDDTAAAPTDLPIVRKPGHIKLFSLFKWADLVFHNNLSMQYIWPLLILKRPWVVAHHTWIRPRRGLRGLVHRAKHYVLRYADCISASKALQESFDTPSVVIENMYNDAVFNADDTVTRDRELVFVGRLVSDKGLDVLLRAMAVLKQAGEGLKCTVIGAGPEREKSAVLAQELGVDEEVTFVGRLAPQEVSKMLNRHQVLVVPSVWNEPFGIVALEGMACGCLVVGASGGGLPQAIGDAGFVFDSGNHAALAEILSDIMQDYAGTAARLQPLMRAHLAPHSIRNTAEQFAAVFESAAAGTLNA